MLITYKKMIKLNTLFKITPKRISQTLILAFIIVGQSSTINGMMQEENGREKEHASKILLNKISPGMTKLF